jgi:hypothetical protein
MHLLVSCQLLRIPQRYGKCLPQMGVEARREKLFFLGVKERPQEAPFMTLEKKVLRGDLQRTAGIGSTCYF